MISPELFFKKLKENEIEFFTGVPDSLLKDFCAYISDNVKTKNHIINANEGACIALAAGYHLATGKSSLVYMQNSGLGNSVNPLLSLADSEVYGIPMLLMIGWRGEPGKKDEPQHIKQGRVMLSMLEAMGIPCVLINSSADNIEDSIDKACKNMKERSSPYAMIISEGTFESYKLKNNKVTNYDLNREDAVNIVLESLEPEDILVSTTGKTSREVFEYRKKNNRSHENDFLTVGSMGHCSQIAFGIALQKNGSKVYILDGDGSVIMHMGSLAVIGTDGPGNIRHVILNNGSHDSVGGQPTAGFKIDFISIAKACGYKLVLSVSTRQEIREALSKLKSSPGPSLLEIKINKGSRDDLGRPTSPPKDNKESFMRFLSK